MKVLSMECKAQHDLVPVFPPRLPLHNLFTLFQLSGLPLFFMNARSSFLLQNLKTAFLSAMWLWTQTQPTPAWSSLRICDNCCTIPSAGSPWQPEQFNLFPCVMGSSRFIAERYYWEVAVRDKAKWTTSICGDSVCRKIEVNLAPQKMYSGQCPGSMGKKIGLLPPQWLPSSCRPLFSWWGFSSLMILVRSPSTMWQRGAAPLLSFILPSVGPSGPTSAWVTQETRMQILWSSAP